MFSLGCENRVCFQNEILSGLTVALALVPEAVAFAFVAGVDPLVGLYAAFMVGLLASIFGGRPGMISGATGAMAVVMVSLVADHGVEYLFATIVLTGLLQITAGILKLGKFIRIVPHPVMLGFVNGLALVIFLAQLQHFQVDVDGVNDICRFDRADDGDHSLSAKADNDNSVVTGGYCRGVSVGDWTEC